MQRYHAASCTSAVNNTAIGGSARDVSRAESSSIPSNFSLNSRYKNLMSCLDCHFFLKDFYIFCEHIFQSPFYLTCIKSVRYIFLTKIPTNSNPNGLLIFCSSMLNAIHACLYLLHCKCLIHTKHIEA